MKSGKFLSSMINLLKVLFYLGLFATVAICFWELDYWTPFTRALFFISMCGVAILFFKFLKKRAEQRAQKEQKNGEEKC